MANPTPDLSSILSVISWLLGGSIAAGLVRALIAWLGNRAVNKHDADHVDLRTRIEELRRDHDRCEIDRVEERLSGLEKRFDDIRARIQ